MVGVGKQRSWEKLEDIATEMAKSNRMEDGSEDGPEGRKIDESGAQTRAKKAVQNNYWTADLVTETYMRKWASASAAEAVEKMTPWIEVTGKQLEASGQLRHLAQRLQENVCPRTDPWRRCGDEEEHDGDAKTLDDERQPEGELEQPLGVTDKQYEEITAELQQNMEHGKLEMDIWKNNGVRSARSPASTAAESSKKLRAGGVWLEF